MELFATLDFDMDHQTVENFVLSLPHVALTYPFGEGVAVYKVELPSDEASSDADVQTKMFALIQEGKDPVRVSLKCDPQLAVVLRERFETVLEGYHLNKKHWNTIILTGQLPWDEVQALIRHSYNLVTGAHVAAPDYS
jgi:predicted DNA-binding protein (MmcQ/YjbR family)